MHSIHYFTLHFNLVVLFGIIVVLGLLGGEIAKLTKVLPRITGYIAVGFIVGPNCLNIITYSLLKNANLLVDISLAVILFDLGRHLDLTWLRNDRGLLKMSIFESFLTFSLIFLILTIFKFPWLPSALVATIAIATSPTVVMMIAHELSADGPIIRRTLVLTSLNNLFAIILFTILLPFTSLYNSTIFEITEYIVYRLVISILLSFIMFYIIMIISKLTGKNNESQHLLFIGVIALSIGLAISFNLSLLITLFILGVVARNFDTKHKLIEIDFGWLLRLSFILIFVVTGAYLSFMGLRQATEIVLVFMFVKILAKMFGVLLFSSTSRLTLPQSFTLVLTLSPMAGLAIGMSNRLLYFCPDFDPHLIVVVTAVVSIFYIFSPIATQIAFMKTGEGTAKNY